MTSLGSWGYFIGGNGKQEAIDDAGSRLSKFLDCPVHYPAFNKRIFECKCGVLFPMFMVSGAIATGDWSLIKEKHARGYRPTEAAY